MPAHLQPLRLPPPSPPHRPLLAAALAALLASLPMPGDAQTLLPSQYVRGTREAPDPLVRVIDRETLERTGARDIAGALAQLPGIVLDRSAERDGDAPRLSLRGLAGGYTLVRVDGLPLKTMGPGVALDGLSLDRVERVEIRTAPRAADGGEAVAGIIDIVLRESAPAGATLSAALLPHGTRLGAEAGWRQGWSGAGWTAQAGLRWRDEHSAWTDRREQRLDLAGTGTPEVARLKETLARRADDRSLALDATLQAASGADRWHAKLLRAADDAGQRTATRPVLLPTYDGAGEDAAWSSRHVTELASAGWRRAGTTRLALEAWLRRDRDDSRGEALAVGDDPADADRWGDRQREREWRSALSLERDVAPGWTLAGGSQLGVSVSCMTSEGDDIPPPCQRRRQPAAWGELQWRPDAGRRLVLGLRREASRLDGIARPRDDRFLLPSLGWQQALDDAGLLRLEASLSRSVRLPRLRELRDGVRQRSGSMDFPDLAGNPALRPERATGAELALAGTLAPAWTGRVGVFARRIDEAMQPVLALGADGRWQLQTRNLGAARSQGLELSADGRLAPGWHLSLSQALYRSTVDALPGPDNRLAGQAPARTTLTLRGSAAGWALNAALRWQPAYAARTTPAQTLGRDAEARLDLGAERSLSGLAAGVEAASAWRLRLGLSDLGRRHVGSTLASSEGGGNARRDRFVAARAPVLRLAVEGRL